MNAAELIEQIDKLPSEEQKKIFVFLTKRIMSRQEDQGKRWVGKKLSFEEACDLVFRENPELLGLLAK